MVQIHPPTKHICVLLLLTPVLMGGCKIPFSGSNIPPIAKPSSSSKALMPITDPAEFGTPPDLAKPERCSSFVNDVAKRAKELPAASCRVLAAATLIVGWAYVKACMDKWFSKETELEKLQRQGYVYRNPTP